MDFSRRSLRPLSLLRTYDIVLLVSLLWFMVQFLRFIFPPLFETLQVTYGISNTQTGLMFTLLMLGYSAAQFPSGWLADRLDEPTVILLGAGVFSAAALFAFVAPTFGLLTAAAVLIGVGTGAHKTVAIPYLSRVYSERTGLALGVMDTIGQFGGMAAPIVVVAVLASALPWRSSFLVAAVATTALAVVFLLRTGSMAGVRRLRSNVRGENWDGVAEANGGGPDADAAPADGHGEDGEETPGDAAEANGDREEADGEQAATDDEVPDETYVSVFLEPRFAAFLLVTMLFTFSWNGLSSFFPLFLTAHKGIGTGTAGVLYSLLFAASLSQAITGGLSDRIGRLSIALFTFLAMIGGLVALIVLESLFALVAMTLVMGIGFHGFRPVRDSYLMDIIPPSIGGGTLGIVRTAMTLVGAQGPAVVGYLSDVAGFRVAFGVIVASLSVAAGLVLLLR